MSKMIQIAPLLIDVTDQEKYVNVYGLSAKGGVYTWDANTGSWVPYVNKELAKAYKPKEKK